MANPHPYSALMEKMRREAARRESNACLDAANDPVSRLPARLDKDCPDGRRAVPNVVLRSALFGAFGKGHRSYFEREQIAAYGNVEIIYTGSRLDQGDLDVWESLLHAARGHELVLPAA